MTLTPIQWIPSSSKSEAMIGAPSGAPVIMTSDDNSWGYFRDPSGRTVIVGYADIGLKPQAIQCGDTVFIGINESLFGIDSASMNVKFTHKMPWVFHEFLQYKDFLLVRDEIGFMGISKDGQEIWEGITEAPIDRFKIEGNSILGLTTDGDSFHFEIGG
ncbi:MAG: hypothetical protein RL186_1307 [Pseudomonadota bacterium]|jgi:hypothetical protein